MYSASTVKRARTILRNADQQRAASRKVLAERKQQNAPTVKADWKTAPASVKQIERIQRKERTIGLPITPSHGAGLTGGEAREWNAALNTMLAAR